MLPTNRHTDWIFMIWFPFTFYSWLGITANPNISPILDLFHIWNMWACVFTMCIGQCHTLPTFVSHVNMAKKLYKHRERREKMIHMKDVRRSMNVQCTICFTSRTLEANLPFNWRWWYLVPPNCMHIFTHFM